MINEQVQDLINMPFVQRVTEFFKMTLEKMKNEPAKRAEFINLIIDLEKQ